MRYPAACPNLVHLECHYHARPAAIRLRWCRLERRCGRLCEANADAARRATRLARQRRHRVGRSETARARELIARGDARSCQARRADWIGATRSCYSRALVGLRSPRTTASAAPTLPSSTTSGPCASCTRRSGRMARIAEIADPGATATTRCPPATQASWPRCSRRHRTGRPMLLSEHGIYTKERKIDLFQSDLDQATTAACSTRTPSQLSLLPRPVGALLRGDGPDLLRRVRSHIVALYENNRLAPDRPTARRSGAHASTFANGIDLPRLSALRARSAWTAPNGGPPRTLCLIGRVVPIKDIKTFIRAMKHGGERCCPTPQGWIAGPEDEDRPPTRLECRNDRAVSWGLENNVQASSVSRRSTSCMPKVGLVRAVSSISEALPLVLLEGYRGRRALRWPPTWARAAS